LPPQALPIQCARREAMEKHGLIGFIVSRLHHPRSRAPTYEALLAHLARLREGKGVWIGTSGESEPLVETTDGNEDYLKTGTVCGSRVQARSEDALRTQVNVMAVVFSFQAAGGP
jgi:hypothetical protein